MLMISTGQVMNKPCSLQQRGRIEVQCKVCGDRASGRHYGVPSCDGCRGFFKRSIRRNLEYVCKDGGTCIVDVTRRNQCQACRFRKCISVNMKRDAVQHERAPRILASKRTLFPPLFFQAPRFSCPSNIFHAPPVYQPRNDMPFSWYFWNSIAPRAQPFREEKLSVDMSPHQEKNTFLSDHEEEIDVVSDSVHTQPLLHLKDSQSVQNNSPSNVLKFVIDWAKSLPSFNQVSKTDRKRLIEKTWPELFVIHSAQWNHSLMKEQDVDTNSEDLAYLIKRIQQFQLDYTEFVCLKSLVLFRHDIHQLENPGLVEFLHSQTQGMLLEHSMKSFHNQGQTGLTSRFIKIILLLPSLRIVTSSKLESIFPCFKGNVDLSI
ncbi:nuclear receptor subfamily 2 group E member 1-like isoform X2 [Artemia franciscana]